MMLNMINNENLGPARGIMTKCYHQPCDSSKLNDTIPFANMDFLSLITQTMIDTLVDATQSTCYASNRTHPVYENNYNNSGSYTIYDKITQNPIVGLDPFRPLMENGEVDQPKVLKKRSSESESSERDQRKIQMKKYFPKNIDPKSFIPQRFEITERKESNIPQNKKRIKDSDPKSYIPPNLMSKKNIDPKSTAQNDITLRYQTTKQKQRPVPVPRYPFIPTTSSHFQPNLSSRVAPGYNLWYPHIPFHSNLAPYWIHPSFSQISSSTPAKLYPQSKAIKFVLQDSFVTRNVQGDQTQGPTKNILSGSHLCYPFCNHKYYYNNLG